MTRLTLLLIWSALAAGCASTGAVPRPFPMPGGFPSAGGSAPAGGAEAGGMTRRPSGPAGTVDGYSISSTALGFRGVPYRNGGSDPQGFDCSGFVQYVFAQHGVRLPRDTRKQFSAGSEVDPSALEPGDLVFFTTVAPGASHVGILVGGDQFVHAPSSTGAVRVESLGSQYWSSRFVGARRVN